MAYLRIADRPMPDVVVLDERTAAPRSLTVECGFASVVEIVANSTVIEMAGDALAVRVHVWRDTRMWPGDRLSVTWDEGQGEWYEVVSAETAVSEPVG